MARNNVNVRSSITEDIQSFKVNLVKAEKKALKKASKLVQDVLIMNTPIGAKPKAQKLKGNTIRKNPTDRDGILTAGVGFNKNAWYYIFTNNGVNNSQVVRKYAKNMGNSSSMRMVKTNPYRLFIREQNYVGKTIRQTKSEVDDIIKSEIDKEIRRANT